jgi:very-short-patch-repair endonuclease
MTPLNWPFIGSEAVANGRIRKHELRAHFRAEFPDVYVPKEAVLTLRQRTVAGWLWSHREGVLAGLTASAWHGAKWVDASSPIELISPNGRRPRGLRTYNMMLRSDESSSLNGLRVTTPERTAFDIGRRGRLDSAIARLDALGNATKFNAEDVLAIADRHRGARGLPALRAALDLYDPGAESLKETWLRLLVIRAGYPRPRTQIPVPSPDGRRRYRLDMGWEDIKLALEYDGEHHRVDPVQYAYDIQRSEDLTELGWTRLRVVKENRSADVLRRLDRIWRSKLLTDRDLTKFRDL